MNLASWLGKIIVVWILAGNIGHRRWNYRLNSAMRMNIHNFKCFLRRAVLCFYCRRPSSCCWWTPCCTAEHNNVCHARAVSWRVWTHAQSAHRKTALAQAQRNTFIQGWCASAVVHASSDLLVRILPSVCFEAEPCNIRKKSCSLWQFWKHRSEIFEINFKWIFCEHNICNVHCIQ